MSTSKQLKENFLGENDLKELKQSSDQTAWRIFGFNWLIIALCFYAIAQTSSILVIFFALLLMAGRQLGIAILMHECAHRSFFKTKGLNDFMGHWFGGMPMLVPIDYYRPYHMTHHTNTGTSKDPDLEAIQQYPVSSESFRRKILRDISGLSGLKMFYGLIAYVLADRNGDTVSLGMHQTADNKKSSSKRNANFRDAAITHLSFIGVLSLLGQPSLYLYWWVSFFFFYPFILRMRQIAEHGAMPSQDSEDVRDNTRTTLATWWERALFAPNYVNYHCEHHLIPTIPSYNLPKLNEILRRNGFYQEKSDALVTGGYLEVARKAANLT